MTTQRWPFGEADHQTPAYAATITASVFNSKTIIEPAILTGNLTLDLVIDPEIRKGDEILVKLKATGTEVTTFGAGINSATIIGAAGKTKTQKFEFDGTNFIAIGAPQQID